MIGASPAAAAAAAVSGGANSSAPEAPRAPPPPLSAAFPATFRRQTSQPRDSLLSELCRLTAGRRDLGVLTAVASVRAAAADCGAIERRACPVCRTDVAVQHLASHRTNHASQVLPFLFVGGERNAHNLKELRDRCRVAHVLNVSWEVANFYPQHFRYKRLVIQDYADEDIATLFEDAFAFIDEARLRGEKVLVHCVQGISRSVSIVIAYLMRSQRWSFDKSLAHVRQQRPIADPNQGFRRQLHLYEENLQQRLGPLAQHAD